MLRCSIQRAPAFDRRLVLSGFARKSPSSVPTMCLLKVTVEPFMWSLLGGPISALGPAASQRGWSVSTRGGVGVLPPVGGSLYPSSCAIYCGPPLPATAWNGQQRVDQNREAGSRAGYHRAAAGYHDWDDDRGPRALHTGGACH